MWDLYLGVRCSYTVPYPHANMKLLEGKVTIGVGS